MLRKTMVVIAIVFLGSSGLSANAFARSGGHGGGGRGDSFRGNHLRCASGSIRAGSFGVYGNRTAGSHNGLPGHGNRDAWGHWGAYYGPMIPAI
jgi:hypothetical protein